MEVEVAKVRNLKRRMMAAAAEGEEEEEGEEGEEVVAEGSHLGSRPGW